MLSKDDVNLESKDGYGRTLLSRCRGGEKNCRE